jgi:hypothetical protein
VKRNRILLGEIAPESDSDEKVGGMEIGGRKNEKPNPDGKHRPPER